MQAMTGFDSLREQNRMTWIEQEHSWAATPEDIVTVLSNEGFEECKREQTTSRRNRRPAGGLWQGVNPARICRVGDLGESPSVTARHRLHEVDGESLAAGEAGPS